MKKRLQTRVMFRIPNSHLHASDLRSDRDRDDTHLNKTGRYQMANKKEEVISSRPGLLLRCTLARCSPPPLPLTLPRQRHDS
jgi:hypothetical protein